MPEEPTSAMGPSAEPGEAKPAKAADSKGLGGTGTEGKVGEPAGGTEPQIPADILQPNDAAIDRIQHDIEAMPPAQDSPAATKKHTPQEAIDDAIAIDEELDED